MNESINQPTIALNAEQKTAVEHAEGPLLIIAGAGTGKTTVITERIKYLIMQQDIKPSQLLALTFTEKAAREMEERVDVALPYGYSQFWISTFHAFCDRILRNEAIQIGLNPGYKLLSEAEAVMLFRQHLFDFNLTYFRPLGNPTKFIGAMLSHFSRLKDEDITPEAYLAWAKKLSSPSPKSKKKKANSPVSTKTELQIDQEKYQELALAFQTYESLKISKGYMDFSDLIAQTLRLFRERPNILSQYKKQFKHILIDEFQDTNYAQYALIQLLAPPQEKPNLLVVGDDNQSVYRFRGAAISNILMFMEHYKTAKTIVLSKNYRSVQEILDHSYQLIHHNDPDTLEAKLKISKKLISARPSAEATGTASGSIKDMVQHIVADAPAKSYSVTQRDTIDVIIRDRVENEAHAVAEKILDLKKQHPTYHWKDFALLVRANNHADPFARAFTRAGIPYQFLGPGMLFQQQVVKDLIAYLRVLADITDSTSLYRLLSMDHHALDARDLTAITAFARKHTLSLFDALELIAANSSEEITRHDLAVYANELPYIQDATKTSLINIVQMLHSHLNLAKKETAGQVLFHYLEDSGLLQIFSTYKTVEEEKAALNIAKFFDKLKTFETEHDDASVRTVVDWLDMRMELGESPLAADSDWMDQDAVTLLTAHSAKGLEFPVVFLVNLVEGRFPTRERHEALPVPESLIKEILPAGDYHLQEERRLFYVGMTRAKDYLILSASNYYGEGKRERKPSPFITEALGPDAVNKTPQVSKKTAETQLFLFDWRTPQEPVQPETAEQMTDRIRKPVTYLSYTQMETFKFCPLHYKAKYLLKIPTPVYAAQSFGQTIHLTLRRFYLGLLQGESWNMDDLLRIYHDAWIPVGYTGQAHMEAMKKEGERELDAFYHSFHQDEPLPVVVEQPFAFHITPQLKIGGVIDRINRLSDGKIEIVDYKTATDVPTQKEVDKDSQLTVYALAATMAQDPRIASTPEEINLTLYYLGKGEKRTTTRTKEQLEKATEEIINLAKKIEVSDFQCSGIVWCKTCEYKMLCNVEH